ncbi:dihydrofolate reductase family protein [Aquihabitans sp. McL0605]|uniref:dihydrofolate reductase family protein n=1 Tax=Aquihabitans sp. McL0605 TaxID=3415671 RepID=UPI003CE80C69
MRIVVSEFMSLDGVVQAPGGPEEDTDGGFAHGGWSLPHFDPEVMGGAIGAKFATVEALLFGRRTFAGMAAAWPERAGDPFADQMNAIEKHVVTSTLTADDITWTNSSVIPGAGALEAIGALRARDGGDLAVMGSVTLVRSLIEAGLVDELNLMIEPVVLGGGKRIFTDDGVGRTFELVDSQVAGTGVLICTYRPIAASVATGHSDELYQDPSAPPVSPT